MEQKDYNLTCGEVIDNLLTLAGAYEKASAGKAPNGFAFNPTDAAANMKAAVAFIGSFGQQLPRWIPVSERLPEVGVRVLGWWCKRGDDFKDVAYRHDPIIGNYWYRANGVEMLPPAYWMPLPEPPEAK